MHIVHGTWIPGEPAEFVQDGSFYLWVETSDRIKRRKPNPAHPGHLSGPTLESFLTESLGIRGPYGVPLSRRFETKSFLLPSGYGEPLPAFELLPYMESDVPEEWELAPWEVCCYPVSHVIGTLNDIHFIATQGQGDFQLGSDLLFWHQYSQELKAIIGGDNYIPALKYRSLPKARKSDPGFELRAAWELISGAYEGALDRYIPAMPAVCGAGFNMAGSTALYEPETLLRHFSERLLHSVVVGTPSTDAFNRKIMDSLLYDCVNPFHPISGSKEALKQYKEWAAWRGALTAAQLDAAFTLCFRLEEPPAGETDSWGVHFLVTAKRDPSLRLELADYWSLSPGEKEAILPRFGPDLERNLLLALGQAARIYPAVWDGLETDRPSGFTLTLEEAFAFLKEHAWVLEDAGYTVMVPAWWTPEGRRRAKVRLKTTARSNGSSNNSKSYFSLDTVIAYNYQLSIGGEAVTEAEWQQLIAAKTPLVRFRGQWLELDRERMEQMLAFWQKQEESRPELTLLDLIKASAESKDDLEWEHDGTLADVLARLQDKSVLDPISDPANFQGELRGYQRKGLAWLRFLERLGLNPCLADDMGLGKTVQVIAQLVEERNDGADVGPTLLIAPTSVLGNWGREIERFAPQLRTIIHQGSARARDEKAFRQACEGCDVVITSFALARLDEKLLRSISWWRVVVDEAQNIKNPQSAQTRAITKLPAERRLALTGTPVENRLRDLWSIFNFLNPGYLGKEPQFRKAFEIPIQKDNDPARSAALKKLVEPFILRRLKTDPQIISDLPDKVEQKVYCNLTPEQASLYEAVVRDVEEQLDEAEGMQRRGLILATLTKLKQICNHPAQFLQDGSEFSSERSQKLQRLGEMMEEVISSGESLLIFTQFTEVGAALERYIRHSLHYNTYYLHGGTNASRRDKMVAEFQDPDTEPSAFILSVRAGGTGLTLTKANHVFHFDRWWNPAVEDQATDRAFRIGQRKNVFAHKFVSMGTVEERIDAMIEDKKRLAATVVGADESWLTELDTDTFKDLIALRRSAIAG